jgi:predicted glycoside hydrolase/deacetylase ChbG (UPF0249 family)
MFITLISISSTLESTNHINLFFQMKQIILAVLLSALVVIVTSQSLAEQLGYSKTAKVLIVNADDFGMCHSENLGTQKVFECGVVKGATMMVTCPWATEAVQMARSRNLTNIGVHLALTSEWGRYKWRPISVPAQNSTLVGKDSFMWETSKQVEQHASVAHVQQEVNAQLRRALDWGLDLSHYDSHMGSLYGIETARFELLAIALANSYEFGLPFRMPYLPNMKPFRDMGHAILDYLLYGMSTPSDPIQHKNFYMNLFKNLSPGVTEIYLHPSVESEEIKSITNAWRGRVNDMNTFCDPDIQTLLQRENVTVINFEPLRKLQREKMKWNPSFRASDVIEKYRRLLLAMDLSPMKNYIERE